MAETYDMLVTLPAAGAWEVRATAQDNSGHASLWIGEGEAHAAPAPSALDPYDMDAMMTAVLDHLDESDDVTDAEALTAESARPLPPYKRLRATQPTALPDDAPVREVTLKLTGDMLRYAWSIDGQRIDEQSTVPVKRGEVLRLTLVNNTMMHHPMPPRDSLSYENQTAPPADGVGAGGIVCIPAESGARGRFHRATCVQKRFRRPRSRSGEAVSALHLHRDRQRSRLDGRGDLDDLPRPDDQILLRTV
jgi:hypothetical protein